MQSRRADGNWKQNSDRPNGIITILSAQQKSINPLATLLEPHHCSRKTSMAQCTYSNPIIWECDQLQVKGLATFCCICVDSSHESHQKTSCLSCSPACYGDKHVSFVSTRSFLSLRFQGRGIFLFM